MFFKNIQAYRLPQNWAMTADALADALAPQKFTDATSMDMVNQGWAPPRAAGSSATRSSLRWAGSSGRSGPAWPSARSLAWCSIA